MRTARSAASPPWQSPSPPCWCGPSSRSRTAAPPSRSGAARCLPGRRRRRAGRAAAEGRGVPESPPGPAAHMPPNGRPIGAHGPMASTAAARQATRRPPRGPQGRRPDEALESAAAPTRSGPERHAGSAAEDRSCAGWWLRGSADVPLPRPGRIGQELGNVAHGDIGALKVRGPVAQHDQTERAGGRDLVGRLLQGLLDALVVDALTLAFLHPHPGTTGAAAHALAMMEVHLDHALAGDGLDDAATLVVHLVIAT